MSTAPRTTPRSMHRHWIATFCLLAGGFLLACDSGPGPLARYAGGAVTTADLDAFLLSLPESNRQVPSGMSRDEWLTFNLERLTLERTMLVEGTVQLPELAEPPELEPSLRMTALVARLNEQLSAAASPTEVQVDERLTSFGDRSAGEPVLNFHHLYLRSEPGNRQLADDLLARLRAGEEFQALAKEYSQSANAARGGAVANARIKDLDAASAQALAALEEGELSPVVTTRTGFHLFRLGRRLSLAPPSENQLRTFASRVLHQEAVATARAELLNRLREETPIERTDDGWRAGSSTLTAVQVDGLRQRAAQAAANRTSAEVDVALTDQFLLAEEARQRGLETPDLIAELERARRVARLDRIFRQKLDRHVAVLDPSRVRPLYDEAPIRFNAPESAQVELIFLSQGTDSFSAQRRAEELVRRLRAGGSFAAVARQESSHSSASDGGDLGRLDRRQWAQLGQAVANTLETLPEGDISDPVYCTPRVLSKQPKILRGGFAILRSSERQPARTRTFEEALVDVRRQYARRYRGEVESEVRQQILDEAGFRILRLPEPGEEAPAS